MSIDGILCWVPLSCPKLTQRIAFLKFPSANGLINKRTNQQNIVGNPAVAAPYLWNHAIVLPLIKLHDLWQISYRSWRLLLSYSAELLMFVTDRVRVNKRPPEIHRDSVSGSNDNALRSISHPNIHVHCRRNNMEHVVLQNSPRGHLWMLQGQIQQSFSYHDTREIQLCLPSYLVRVPSWWKSSWKLHRTPKANQFWPKMFIM